MKRPGSNLGKVLNLKTDLNLKHSGVKRRANSRVLGVVHLDGEQPGTDVRASGGDQGPVSALLAEDLDGLCGDWLFPDRPGEEVPVLTSRAILDAAVVSDVSVVDFEWELWSCMLDIDSRHAEILSGVEEAVGELGVVRQFTFSRRADLGHEGDLVIKDEGCRQLRNVWVSVHGELTWIN